MFEVGPKVNIEDLPEDVARSIFGTPVYEAWRKSVTERRIDTFLVVTDVNHETGTITLKASK
jgi:hypothetical protein